MVKFKIIWVHVASTVQAKVHENKNKSETKKTQISFVKEGQKGQKQEQIENYNYLSTAKDWSVSVDLGSNLKIPTEICVTNLRPDLIIVSRKTKQLGIVELTEPIEDRTWG